MGLKVQFDINKVMADAKQALREDIEEKLIIAFRLAFTDAANYAKLNNRDSGTVRYTDQTGALNSSTGFQLYRNGEMVHSFFQGEGGDGSGHNAGIKAGNEAAEKGAEDMKDKWICGVLVAGMDYAWAVETGYRGKDEDGKEKYVTAKDVLSAAEFKLPIFLKERLESVFGGSEVFKITTTDEF